MVCRFLDCNARSTFVSGLIALALTSACSGERQASSTASQPAGTSGRAAPASAEIPPRTTTPSVEIADLYYLRSVGDLQFSPDGKRIVFAVQKSDRPGAPYTEIWMADAAGGQAAAFSSAPEGSSPDWSPDGTRIAYFGRTGEGKSGVLIANADGTNAIPIADTLNTNHPFPQIGSRLAWSPDGKQVAFVAATPSAEPEMEGDPIVITRYMYRPASSAGGRFNDNRRLHLFVADVASRQVRQLTDGTFSEHSIDWSPDGKQLVFLSNHEPDPDFRFNYDMFTIDVASGAVRQLTATKNVEYRPRWSPDGRLITYQGMKRPITSSETNMEDTHIWVLDAASGERRELGITIDNRQGAPQWSPDGQFGVLHGPVPRQRQAPSPSCWWRAGRGGAACRRRARECRRVLDRERRHHCLCDGDARRSRGVVRETPAR